MSLRDQLKEKQARPGGGKSKMDEFLATVDEGERVEILEALLDPDIQHTTILRYLEEQYGFEIGYSSLTRFRISFGKLVQRGSK